jgi:hypothetical protein
VSAAHIDARSTEAMVATLAEAIREHGLTRLYELESDPDVYGIIVVVTHLCEDGWEEVASIEVHPFHRGVGADPSIIPLADRDEVRYVVVWDTDPTDRGLDAFVRENICDSTLMVAHWRHPEAPS